MNQTDFTKEFIIQSKYPLPVRCFSVSEYQKMGEAGILSEDEHIELIDGVIIQMSTEGTRHSVIMSNIAAQFYELVIEGKALLRVQNPIVLSDDTEPEPDLALVKTRESAYYLETHPRPDDVLLLIEVADTSLEYDKEIKLSRYADSKIEEVWIINLVDSIIEVYREPLVLANGIAGYRIRTDFAKEDTILPQAAPSLEIVVDDVLI
ncbi:Uma2 family endonuclease [bacterium]|nr:Uma2 family endonuclease [bacterium]